MLSFVTLGLFWAFLALSEAQVRFESSYGNETIIEKVASYDSDIDIPYCYSTFETKGCRFVKRWLGFGSYWNVSGYMYEAKPYYPDSFDSIVDCTKVNKFLIVNLIHNEISFVERRHSD